METIIKQSFSDMLDKLLEKALEEKPKFIEDNRILKYKNIMLAKYGLVFYGNNEWGNGYNSYPLEFTDEQKKITDEIFEKWGNNE